MDRLTHTSITNCVKELDCLEKLILSGEFSQEEIASWVAQISWELSNVFQRIKYDSDEFQHRLKLLIQKNKRPRPVENTDEP
jgi:hypothetical protein